MFTEFAKIFNTSLGQVVVLKTVEGGFPYLAVKVYHEDFGEVTTGCKFKDESFDDLSKAFERFDDEAAFASAENIANLISESE